MNKEETLEYVLGLVILRKNANSWDWNRCDSKRLSGDKLVAILKLNYYIFLESEE
jgi:hypothetical protein